MTRKILLEGWNMFRQNYFGAQPMTSEVETALAETCRRAYYYGAAHLYYTLVDRANPKPTEEDFLRQLQQLRSELQDFAFELVRRAPPIQETRQ